MVGRSLLHAVSGLKDCAGHTRMCLTREVWRGRHLRTLQRGVGGKCYLLDQVYAHSTAAFAMTAPADFLLSMVSMVS